MRWFDRLPLFGKRILVTRPEHQAEDTARAIRERGAEPVIVPAIEIVRPPTSRLSSGIWTISVSTMSSHSPARTAWSGRWMFSRRSIVMRVRSVGRWSRRSVQAPKAHSLGGAFGPT